MHRAHTGLVCLRTCLLAGIALAVACISVSPDAEAAPVAVRYTEGVTHGFLTLPSTAGDLLAEGDLLQVVRPEGVDSRLVFRLVFTQSKVFTLVSYRLRPRGPSFPEQVEIAVDRERDGTGRYEVTSQRAGGEAETVNGDIELPPDVYNGTHHDPP